VLETPLDDIARCDVLGVQVSAINIPMAVTQIHKWIDRRECNYVCITGVHGVMDSQRDPTLKRIHNAAGMVTPDGMPLVWINRLRGNGQVQRVYGPDLMLEICKLGVEKNHKHFLYGGGDGVAEKLKAALEERFPGINVVGTYTPPFRPLTDAEDHDVVQMINKSGADIVWIGLSTPKQERWMSKHIGRLHAPVMVGVGAAFDFISGTKKQAPRWIGRIGMEWSYRMCCEPKRLGKRYLVNNPLFVWNMLLQSFGWKDFSADNLTGPAKATRAA
jgi:N-acetylglucosaminyldiphosphoundecaprenol N-acetyl-beta-D-mannosaminyltransferase